ANRRTSQGVSASLFRSFSPPLRAFSNLTLGRHDHLPDLVAPGEVRLVDVPWRVKLYHLAVLKLCANLILRDLFDLTSARGLANRLKRGRRDIGHLDDRFAID